MRYILVASWVAVSGITSSDRLRGLMTVVLDRSRLRRPGLCLSAAQRRKPSPAFLWANDDAGPCVRLVKDQKALWRTAADAGPAASTVTPVANRDNCPSSILSSTLTLAPRPFTPFTCRISSRSSSVGGGRFAGAVDAFAFLLVLCLPLLWPANGFPLLSFFRLSAVRATRAASGRSSSSSSSSSSASLREE